MTMLRNKNFLNFFSLQNQIGTNICEHASISKHEFLQKLKVNPTKSQSIEKSTRKQRKSKEWEENRKNRLTSTSAHKISIRKKTSIHNTNK